jgi:cobalt/nickel transport system permease protein
MHIPDGFLDGRTAAVSAALSVTALGVALNHAKRSMPPRRIPLLGLTASFIFAAQMLNFPVAGGTSGHLIGAVLAAILLGPSGAVVAITAVLIVQALLFADGGILALGANVFNMAVAGSVGGYALYRLVRRFAPGDRGQLLAAGFSSWAITVSMSLLCAGELAWSGTSPWSITFPAMANIHMIIGLGEGIITMLAVAAIARVRPDLLEEGNGIPAGSAYGPFLVYGAIIVLGLVFFISPFASPWPDGLERVASALGFEGKALSPPVIHAPIAGYRIPGLGSSAFATGVAGAVGVVVVFGLSFLFAHILVRGHREGHPT